MLSPAFKKLHSFFFIDTDTPLNNFRRKRKIQGRTHKQCFKCF